MVFEEDVKLVCGMPAKRLAPTALAAGGYAGDRRQPS